LDSDDCVYHLAFEQLAARAELNTFYHFTAQRFLKSILKNGLTRGCMLKTLNPLTVIPNKQWITKNPDFDQSWLNPNSTLPYKRNEVRLTICIPEHGMENCKPWTQMQFLVPDVAKDLSAYGDPENWWVYDGNIPAIWITDQWRRAVVTSL
jgi:hypothetical protein